MLQRQHDSTPGGKGGKARSSQLDFSLPSLRAPPAPRLPLCLPRSVAQDLAPLQALTVPSMADEVFEFIQASQAQMCCDTPAPLLSNKACHLLVAIPGQAAAAVKHVHCPAAADAALSHLYPYLPPPSLQALGLEQPPDVLGWALGGGVAVAMAARHGEQLGKASGAG